MKLRGYKTHQVGKWDAGMVTPTHTPLGRGYDTSLNYFGHGNWMYTENEWGGSTSHLSDFPVPTGIKDFWDTDRPAHSLAGSMYEEYIFRDRFSQIIRTHNVSEPLFLNYDAKLAHYPLQVPPSYQKKFENIEDINRRMYNGMVSFFG